MSWAWPRARRGHEGLALLVEPVEIVVERVRRQVGRRGRGARRRVADQRGIAIAGAVAPPGEAEQRARRSPRLPACRRRRRALRAAPGRSAAARASRRAAPRPADAEVSGRKGGSNAELEQVGIAPKPWSVRSKAMPRWPSSNQSSSCIARSAPRERLEALIVEQVGIGDDQASAGPSSWRPAPRHVRCRSRARAFRLRWS